MATHQPFTPTCNPIDPEGTAELIDELNAWFEAGVADGETNDDHIDAGLAILDRMTPVAGVAFTSELTVYLARYGLAGMAAERTAA